MFLLRFFFLLLANVILSRRHLVFTRASDMPFSNVSSPRVVWLYVDQKPTSNASKITIFRAQIRKNNTSVFVMKHKYTTNHSRDLICNGEFPSEFPLAKHNTRKRRIYLSRMGSLFPIQNAFHLGAYQVAINEAADVDSTGTSSLSSSDAIEKDCYVYRSYIALGSYQVRF